MISPVETWVAERTGLCGNLSPETLFKWQYEKLQSQIQYARKNSRFYREKLPSAADLTELPFTSPSDIANDPLAFLAVPQSSVARVTTLTTSGTTGTKKRIFFTDGDLERTVDFFAAGMSTMVCKGKHALILISNDTENSLGSLLREGLSRIGVISCILGDIQTASTALEASQNADCLIGMPAEILYMSRTDHDLQPDSVLLTADFVPEGVINSIKETWKCRVFTHYGLSEVGFGCAVECEQHTGHHMRDADLIIEIVDPKTGRPANPGDCGEIVITTLGNEAMPLIRYRTGDIASILKGPCECGGMLQRLGRIDGRWENDIPVGSDETLSIHKLDEIIFADPVVRGFDVLLKGEKEKYTLYLTVDAYGHPDLSSLAAKLPQSLRIEIKYGKADPFSHRGKRRLHIGQG
ncbi:MAG: DVU_1553 family AMP-dependent CoA ligase [Bacteroidales bacterium]